MGSLVATKIRQNFLHHLATQADLATQGLVAPRRNGSDGSHATIVTHSRNTQGSSQIIHVHILTQTDVLSFIYLLALTFRYDYRTPP